jgi:hypothetical protein
MAGPRDLHHDLGEADGAWSPHLHHWEQTMTSGQTVTFPNDDATRELSVDELDLVAAGEFSASGLVQAIAIGAAGGAVNGIDGIPGGVVGGLGYVIRQIN